MLVHFRFAVSDEELAVIDHMARALRVSRSDYVRACLEEPDGKLGLDAAVKGQRLADVTVRVPVAGQRAAKAAAKALGVPMRRWARMRVLGAPPRRLKENTRKRRGRPSEMDKYRDMLKDGKHLLRAATLMESPEALRVLVQEMFMLLKRSGDVQEGDQAVLFQLCKTVARIEYRDVAVERSTDPHVAVPTRRQTIIYGYSPRHGVVELAEVPPGERHKRGRLIKKQKTMRL